LPANLLRPHIENERLSAFLDQSNKIVDRDPVGAEPTDKCLPPPPSCQQIQAEQCDQEQGAELADIRHRHDNIIDGTLKHPARRDGYADE
jgi:hypothetical protein